MPLPTERPRGLHSPLTARGIKYGSRANVALFRLTKGRLGGRWRIGPGWRKPVPILLLDHVGRSSGQSYSAPLVYLEDGPDIIVIASQGGLPKHPQWYRNLLAAPDTSVLLPGGARRPVRARVAAGAEREELWAKAVAHYADFATYQGWTDREIPVVVLEPREEA